MGELLRRRIALAGSSLPEWDYEWDYTMGYPFAPLEKDSRGTVTELLVSDGLRLRTASGSGNRLIGYRSTSDLCAAVGAIEAKVKVKYRSANAGGYTRVGFSNGTNGINVILSAFSSSSGKIILGNAQGDGNGTVIGTFTSDVYKVIRVELENGVGKVYVDGVLAASNLASSSMYYANQTAFYAFNFKEDNDYHYAQYEYFKVKLGRL